MISNSIFYFIKLWQRKSYADLMWDPPPPKIFKIYQIHIVNLPKSPPPFTGRQLYSPRKKCFGSAHGNKASFNDFE